MRINCVNTLLIPHARTSVTVLLILCCGLAFTPVSAWSSPAFQLEATQRFALMGAVEYTLADRHADLATVAEMAFTPLSESNGQIRTRSKAVWFRFNLENTSPSAVKWVVAASPPQLDEVTLFTRNQDESDWHRQSVSDRQPFNERDIRYRKPAISHTTPGVSSTTAYLRVAYSENDSLIPQVTLWEEKGFYNHIQREYLWLGAYYGLMATLTLITVLFAVTLKDRSFLYYGLFLFSTTLMWAVQNGLVYQYLLPESLFLHNEGYHIFFLLFALSALQFSKVFLRTREVLPRIHLFFTIAQALALGGLAIRFAGIYRPVTDLSLFVVAILLLLPVATWQAYRKGVDHVLWYAIGWIVYGLGMVTNIGGRLLFWSLPLEGYILQLASLVQAMVLTIAMGERLLYLNRDRLKAIEEAQKDPLTGLGNRRVLHEAYDNLRDHFRHAEAPLFLLLIDLDHFKSINDRFGHNAGDAVIRDMADLLRRLSRREDVCVRFGGEEFAVLLQANTLAEAEQIAERIRREFEHRPTVYEKQQIDHTLSIGIARVATSNAKRPTFENLIAVADEALYAAKSAGRNRAVAAESDEINPFNDRQPATDS